MIKYGAVFILLSPPTATLRISGCPPPVVGLSTIISSPSAKTPSGLDTNGK